MLRFNILLDNYYYTYLFVGCEILSSICSKIISTARFDNRNLEKFIGDSGYPIKRYLITPLQNVNDENLFNESQIWTRNVVKYSYGIWKRRSPALAVSIRLKLEATIKATAYTTSYTTLLMMRMSMNH